MLCCRGTRTCKRSTARCFSCCCRRRATEAPRQIQDHGVSRALDPDSESEAEVVSDPCEAVLVGLELQGKPRALAPEGCEDRAASEPTRLLESDLQLSDLSGKECARLCNHHSQLYMLSCQGRKCSVVSRFCKVHGAHRGTPLCKKHLSETGRAQSPSPPPKSTGPKPEEPLLHSIRRSQSADVRKDSGTSRMVRFAEQSPTAALPLKSSTASEFEPPSKAERSAHPKSGAPVLVRLRTFFGTGSPSNWYLFLGEVEGISEDSRRTERAVLFIHSCQVSVKAVQLAPSAWQWLREWDGKSVTSSEGTAVGIKPEQVCSLKDPQLVILGHDEGKILTGSGPMRESEFGTPPRPPTMSVLENVTVENPGEGAPPDVEPELLLESFRDAKSQGTSVSEAVTLVANAFGVSPEIVQLSMLGAVDSQGFGAVGVGNLRSSEP